MGAPRSLLLDRQLSIFSSLKVIVCNVTTPRSVAMPSRLHMTWIVLYGSISIFSSSVAASCYLPNGTDSNNGLPVDLYRPCDRSNEHSMCCRTQDRDPCRNDGLCFDARNNDIWRGSCTDPTWESPACIKLCVKGIGTLLLAFDVLVRRRLVRS